LPKESFLYDGTQELCTLIDRAGHKAGIGRGQAFDDFLHVTVCALAHGLMEEEYLATVRKGYDRGEAGKRGIDVLTQAFGTLVRLMEDNRDYLGDLFQGGITYGEAGQFFTPESITSLMTALTAGDETDEPPGMVCDPCCGSGRMLLSYAAAKRPHELVGQDIDIRCVRMTAINLGLRNLYGFVLWGNSLAGEVKLGYRTGFNLQNTVIRPMREDELEQFRIHPLPQSAGPSNAPPPTFDDRPESSQGMEKAAQKLLF
jgi:hypothetical protein